MIIFFKAMKSLTAALAAAALLAGGSALAAEKPRAAEAKNMRLVGADPLQARSAYQPVIERQGERFIAYIGHHGGSAVNPLTGKTEANGTSIVDVTDPRKPRYLYHIPGSAEGQGEAGGAQMARVCDGLPGTDRAKFFLLRTLGNQGHEVWDVTDPSHPAHVSTVVTGLTTTHKNWWECDTGIAYLVSWKKEEGGWRSRGAKIFDLSDPAKPRFIREYGLVGAEPGSKGGEPPQPLHGPIRLGNRVYFGYGSSSSGTLQIVDRDKLLKGDPNARDPFAPTAENILYAQISRLELYPNGGAHTTFPVLGIDIPDFAKNTQGKRADFLVVVEEATQNECREYRKAVFFVDITEEKRPFSVSNFQVPEASGDFCSRGGRFGAHSSNESFTPIYYKRVIFVTHFNAGVRAIDIRDPYRPKEIGYYIPAITDKTDKRCVPAAGGGEACKVAIQTNNVEVDDRGYIYIVDRANTGMHILELTGDARKVANFPN
ncbi:MAG TPA: hypothetical protein VL754_18610 [Verrucomicrobiae bacterium]|jgi:hypothetical protein|nr:hypothetical protein [Verrucomicrobiae bacterium]